MNEEWKQEIPNAIELKICPRCEGQLNRDIFQFPESDKPYSGRLFEADACFNCKIIYKILGDKWI